MVSERSVADFLSENSPNQCTAFMQFLKDEPTRNLFFTGKGGVGKTSMACAAAIQLADRGMRVLLVSTDPASNLDEVLEQAVGNDPTPIEAVPNLCALNIDPEVAAREYRERMVGPYRGVLPEAAVASMEEQFSGSCTVEIAAFDEFAKLLGGRELASDFDHILFDTAPTGHTLRLLTLPSAWSGFVESNTSGTSCLGPLAGLQAQQALYKQTVSELGDHASTTVILVARPEASAFLEAERTSGELKELGICNQRLIVNGTFECSCRTDRIGLAWQKRTEEAVAEMPINIGGLPRTTIPYLGEGLMGVEALRNVSLERKLVHEVRPPDTDRIDTPESLRDVVDDLAISGRGVVLAMGKGGVGKTTVAAAVAVALAERGFKVYLTTTDPAAHLGNTTQFEDVPYLTVRRIDPERETSDYRAEVMDTAGKDLDDAGKALLEEDLRSPCTEEIAVFRAFARVVAQGEDGLVVLDTAPTGHTILLLDAALAYHREVTRQTQQMPESVERLLPRLRDPDFTRVLLVTLPEATPVHEAARLQDDLHRAGIAPYAWIVNQSFAPLQLSDPTLLQRQQREQPLVAEVVRKHATRVASIPWQVEPPVGIRSLSQIGDSIHAAGK